MKSRTGLGVKQMNQRTKERRYNIGDHVNINIRPEDENDEWITRSGNFEGFAVDKGIIYVVLFRSNNTETPYRLIPISRFAKSTLDLLGGVPASCYEELKSAPHFQGGGADEYRKSMG